VPLPVASDSPEIVATSLTLAPTVTGEVARSEERRVGKETSALWPLSPHLHSTASLLTSPGKEAIQYYVPVALVVYSPELTLPLALMPSLVDSHTGVVWHLLSDDSLTDLVPLPVASDSPEIVATSLTLAPTVTGEVAEVLIAGLAFVTLSGSQGLSAPRFCGGPLVPP